MPKAGIIATSKIHSEATTEWTKYIRQLLADNLNMKKCK
jgi:hypothetical protein